MMDPLSIVGGIVAVGQATGSIGKCAEFLYEISYKAGVLAEDVKFFASHIDSFGSIISGVHSIIDIHYKNDNNSSTLQRYHERNTLKQLASQSKRLMYRVRKLEPRLKARDTKLGFLGRFRWLRQKDERTEICLWMDRVKLSFQMIMHQVMYEALQQRASNPSSLEREHRDLKREMRKLKRFIRTTLKSMAVVRERHESLDHGRNQPSEEVPTIAFNDIENVIVDLGRSMVEDRLPLGSSVVSATTGSRSSEEVPFRDARRYSVPFKVVRSEDSALPQSSLQPSRSESPDSDMGLDIIPHPGSVPPDREQTRTPQSLSLSASTASAELQEDYGTVETPNEEEGDYMAVQPSENLIYLDPDANSVMLQGYVNSEVKPTNAIVNPEFPQNVISQLHATQLGLQIEYFRDDYGVNVENAENLEEDEEMGIDFGDGDVHLVIGRVTFRWRDSRQSTRLSPLKVSCLVCEYVPFQTPFVFGKKFIDRRRHYWG